MFLEHCKQHVDTPKKYHILLIVTDGSIHDDSESRATLVELSDYPCSIIIIGVGDGDFSDMVALDSDKKKLKDDDGNVTFRDIVQFVPFSEAVKQHRLGERVLEELPRQFVDHMIRHDLHPDEAATSINN